MATAQQINANRENAQASTGPVSPEGKQTAGKNAMRHGLSAASIESFPIEVRAEYSAFHKKLEAEMLPGSNNELLYFDQYVFAHFMAVRCRTIEMHAMQQAVSNPADEQSIKAWKAATRYALNHARAAEKALAAFREFQSDRYNAVLVQDEITHELNSDVTVPISAPLTTLLRPVARQHDNKQTALCVVYAEMSRRERQDIELQNEPNLNQDLDPKL